MEKFGEKVRLLRQHHNVKLIELSSVLGYNTHSYLSEIESGRKIPTVALVLKISSIFNISTDVLLKDNLEVELNKTMYAPKDV